MLDNPLPLLTSERIEIIKKIESKKCAFDLLTELLEKGQDEVEKHEIFDALIVREKLGSTCAGNGIAIPRAHMKISHPVAALLIIKKGLDIETVDNKPIKIFLAFIIPEKQRKKYSKIIKKLYLILAKGDHRKTFIATDNSEYTANYFESLFNGIMNNDEKQDDK